MSEDALLAAIVDAPDDDAPRLVYADYLQAKGDPRGEFIQLQCQLAAAPDDRRRAIKIAENKLMAAHGDAWLAPIRAAIPMAGELQGHRFEFVRGFVERAQLTVDCAPYFAELWERAPLLRSLRLSTQLGIAMPLPKPSLEGVLEAPQLARLHHLELLFGGAGNAGAAVVARSAQLCNLRSLALSLSTWGEAAGIFERGSEDLALDDEGVAELARSPFLSNVATLLLGSNRITSNGANAISHGLWRLKQLELGNNVLEPETLARCLEGPALANLEVLGISDTAFDPKSIAALVSSKALANLRELDLEKCHLGVAGIEALCKSLALPALRSLRLERNSLADKGAFAIAECAAFAQLTNLEAGHNRMGHKAAVALSSSPHLANLERLTLNEPRWKPETTALFQQSPTLANAKIYLGGRLMGRKKPIAVPEPPAKKPKRAAPKREQTADTPAPRAKKPAAPKAKK